MGALNPVRLEKFKERYEGFDDPIIPKFHYGSHYSSAGTVSTSAWATPLVPRPCTQELPAAAHVHACVGNKNKACCAVCDWAPGW